MPLLRYFGFRWCLSFSIHATNVHAMFNSAINISTSLKMKFEQGKVEKKMPRDNDKLIVQKGKRRKK